MRQHAQAEGQGRPLNPPSSVSIVEKPQEPEVGPRGYGGQHNVDQGVGQGVRMEGYQRQGHAPVYEPVYYRAQRTRQLAPIMEEQ